MAAHSLLFGSFEVPLETLIERLNRALAELNLSSDGGYTLAMHSSDGSQAPVIASTYGGSQRELPTFSEPRSAWNRASIELREGVDHYILSLRGTAKLTVVALVFPGDALERPGQERVVELMHGFVEALETDAALLVSQDDSGTVNRRLQKGESLREVILARVEKGDPLGPPLLALIRPRSDDEIAQAFTRKLSVDVSMTTGGFLLFSSLPSP